MAMLNFLLGRGEFKSVEEIKETIRNSKNFDNTEESYDSAEALMIFQTSKQQTWLLASSKRLYCVLDDINKSFTKVQWSLRKDKIIKNNQIKIKITTREYKENTAFLDIGEHTDWLLSKKLFVTENAIDKINNLITRQMINV